MSLIRNSENKLNINLKFNGEKNKFFYEIENFKQNFLVLGEKYSYNIKNKSFQFSYILFDENHNEINRIKITIEYVKKEGREDVKEIINNDSCRDPSWL